MSSDIIGRHFIPVQCLYNNTVHPSEFCIYKYHFANFPLYNLPVNSADMLICCQSSPPPPPIPILFLVCMSGITVQSCTAFYMYTYFICTLYSMYSTWVWNPVQSMGSRLIDKTQVKIVIIFKNVFKINPAPGSGFS